MVKATKVPLKRSKNDKRYYLLIIKHQGLLRVLDMGFSWKTIWSGKAADGLSNASLADLIRLNGFDLQNGGFTESQFAELACAYASALNIQPQHKVVEVGCGSGAFIKCIQAKINADFYGVDYSPSLINIAKKAMPSSVFSVAEANKDPFPEKKFDVVMFHSVFQYFPSMKYAEEVLKLWAAKVERGGCLGIFDLNNAELENEYHSRRMRFYNSEREYWEMYRDAEHLFFRIDVLRNLLSGLGLRDIDFFESFGAENKNSGLRFGVIAKR